MVDKNEPKYVYRLLNELEKPERGLWAKNPKADISIQEHVETGSWGTESQFISTSATLGAVQQFARNSKSRRKRIVEINLTEVEKIPGNKIYDLSVERNRKMHLRSEKSLNFARKFQEVLIQGNVPPEWIEIQCDGEFRRTPEAGDYCDNRSYSTKTSDTQASARDLESVEAISQPSEVFAPHNTCRATPNKRRCSITATSAEETSLGHLTESTSEISEPVQKIQRVSETETTVNEIRTPEEGRITWVINRGIADDNDTETTSATKPIPFLKTKVLTLRVKDKHITWVFITWSEGKEEKKQVDRIEKDIHLHELN